MREPSPCGEAGLGPLGLRPAFLKFDCLHDFLAGLDRGFEALDHVRPGDGFTLFSSVGQPALGFLAQAPHQFGQILVGHRQLDAVAVVVLGPAEVLEEAEVFAELDAEAFGGGVVLLALHRYEDVAEGGEVVAHLVVERVAFLAGDLDRLSGHGAFLSVGHRSRLGSVAVDLPQTHNALGESVAHRRLSLRRQAPGRSTAAGAIYVFGVGGGSSVAAEVKATFFRCPFGAP